MPNPSTRAALALLLTVLLAGGYVGFEVLSGGNGAIDEAGVHAGLESELQDPAGSFIGSAEAAAPGADGTDIVEIAAADAWAGAVLSARPGGRGSRGVPSPISAAARPVPTATPSPAVLGTVAEAQTAVPLADEPAPATPPAPTANAAAPTPTATPTPGSTTTAAGQPAMSGAEGASLAALNRVRAAAGAPPLTLSAELSAFALEWSQEMALSGFRHSGGPYGENVGWYGHPYISADAAAEHFHNRWVNSPAHYENMTHDAYTEVGIAFHRDAFGWWATHVFR